MSWGSPDVRKGAFDTETTGTSITEDRIVTAAFVVRGGGRPDRTFSWVINPGVPVPEEAAEVHGWTTERVQVEGRDPKAVLDEIASVLADALTWGMPVAAFNAVFDWSVLHWELKRHGLATVYDRVGADPVTLICPLVLDKALDRYRPGSRKLKPTCELYGVELTDWHTAEADALAALLLTEKIAERYPEVGALGPTDLFARQQTWARSQAESFQSYLRSARAGEKRDPLAVVDGSWPLRLLGGGR